MIHVTIWHIFCKFKESEFLDHQIIRKELNDEHTLGTNAYFGKVVGNSINKCLVTKARHFDSK